MYKKTCFTIDQNKGLFTFYREQADYEDTLKSLQKTKLLPTSPLQVLQLDRNADHQSIHLKPSHSIHIHPNQFQTHQSKNQPLQPNTTRAKTTQQLSIQVRKFNQKPYKIIQSTTNSKMINLDFKFNATRKNDQKHLMSRYKSGKDVEEKMKDECEWKNLKGLKQKMKTETNVERQKEKRVSKEIQELFIPKKVFLKRMHLSHKRLTLKAKLLTPRNLELSQRLDQRLDHQHQQPNTPKVHRIEFPIQKSTSPSNRYSANQMPKIYSSRYEKVGDDEPTTKLVLMNNALMKRVKKQKMNQEIKKMLRKGIESCECSHLARINERIFELQSVEVEGVEDELRQFESGRP